MEFSDIFFTIIVPILTALLAGYGVWFLDRMRAETRSKEFKGEIDELQASCDATEAELKDLRDNAEARNILLRRWQEDFIKPLEKIRGNLGLGATIGFETFERRLSAEEENELAEILELVQELRAAKVPVLPAILNNLGMILVVADRLDEATEMFREALEADSTDLDARANLGSIHLMMRNHNEAVSEFEALIELARHRYDGHVGLGLALVQLGKFDNGISAFTNAIRLRPEHTLSYCELGRAYMNAGEMDRAMESTKVALKLAPDIYGGNLLLQQLLVKMGRFDAAVKECRSYLARHEDAEVYYNLATAYALSGDRESALHELRRAIQLGGHLRFRAKDDRTFELLRDSRRFNDLLAGKPGLF